MFDAFKAFLRGQLNVGHFHVVLVIEPCFGAQFNARTLRHQPHGFDRMFRRWHTFWDGRFDRLTACGLTCGKTGTMRVTNQFSELQMSVR